MLRATIFRHGLQTTKLELITHDASHIDVLDKGKVKDEEGRNFNILLPAHRQGYAGEQIGNEKAAIDMREGPR